MLDRPASRWQSQNIAETTRSSRVWTCVARAIVLRRTTLRRKGLSWKNVYSLSRLSLIREWMSWLLSYWASRKTVYNPLQLSWPTPISCFTSLVPRCIAHLLHKINYRAHPQCGLARIFSSGVGICRRNRRPLCSSKVSTISRFTPPLWMQSSSCNLLRTSLVNPARYVVATWAPTG